MRISATISFVQPLDRAVPGAKASAAMDKAMHDEQTRRYIAMMKLPNPNAKFFMPASCNLSLTAERRRHLREIRASRHPAKRECFRQIEKRHFFFGLADKRFSASVA